LRKKTVWNYRRNRSKLQRTGAPVKRKAGFRAGFLLPCLSTVLCQLIQTIALTVQPAYCAPHNNRTLIYEPNKRRMSGVRCSGHTEPLLNGRTLIVAYVSAGNSAFWRHPYADFIGVRQSEHAHKLRQRSKFVRMHELRFRSTPLQQRTTCATPVALKRN